MTLKTSDYLLGKRTGDPTTVLALLDTPDTKDAAYVAAVVRWSLVAGVDPFIMLVQWLHETDNATSVRWNDDLNPAGIFIPADTTVQPFAITTADEAARIHVQCLFSIVRGAFHPAVPIPSQAQATMTNRWLGRMGDPAWPDVEQISDLQTRYVDRTGEPQATWAWDDTYVTQLIAKAKRFYPDLADQNTFTQPDEGGTTVYPTQPDVRAPKIRNLRTDYAYYGLSLGQANEVLSHRFVGRNGGRPLAEYGHVQDGKTPGSLIYWSDPGVEASAHYMVEGNGDACRVINDEDGAWTNGDVNQPLEEIRYLLNLGGNLNNWTLTIEADGDASNVLTAEERLTIIWIMETWAIKYPEIMANLVNRTHGHYTANSVSRSFCGRYVPSIDEHLKAWIANAGTEIPDRPDDKPISLFPKGLSPELARELYGSVSVPWSSKVIGFDIERTECQTWLVRGARNIPDGGTYTDGEWPKLDDIIRRGKTKNVHVYQYSNGDTYEKIVRKDTVEAKADAA